MRLAALTICLSVGHGLFAQAPEPLVPAWQWQPPTGIEWVEVVGVARPALLAATRDARLHLIDPLTGQGLLPRPLRAGPGVRPVAARAPAGCSTVDRLKTGPTDDTPLVRESLLAPIAPASQAHLTPPDVVYCYDRFCVYAIQLTPHPALRWKVGTWREELGEGPGSDGDPAQMFQGDPEELRRVVAAHATAWGVLAARDDGRMALLNHDDGRVRWGLTLPRLGSVRMHVCGRKAALVWKEGPRVAGALVDVQSGRRRDVPLPDEVGWPIWSALTEQGLVLVHPRRISVWTPEQPTPRWCENPFSHLPPRESIPYSLDETNAVLAAAVALYTPPSSGAAGKTHERLVFGSRDGRLRALDLRTAAAAWTVRDQSEGPAHWNAIRLHGDVVIAMTDVLATFYHVVTGRRLGRFAVGPQVRLLDVGMTAGAVWLLTIDSRADQPRLCLQRFHRWCENPFSHPAIAGARIPSRTYRLGPAGVFLRAIWSKKHVIVASTDELCAYPLR